jgi:hypothetical protein
MNSTQPDRPNEGGPIECLSPLPLNALEESPETCQADVHPLLGMRDTEVQSEVQQRLPHERWVAYESLLEKQKPPSCPSTSSASKTPCAVRPMR